MAQQNKVKTDCKGFNSIKNRCERCNDLTCRGCKFYEPRNKNHHITKPFNKIHSGYTVADVVSLFSRN